MDLDHSVKLNQKPITLPELETTLTEVFRKRAVKNLFIRGDSALPYGDVFVLLDIAKRSGVGDMSANTLAKSLAPNGWIWVVASIGPRPVTLTPAYRSLSRIWRKPT